MALNIGLIGCGGMGMRLARAVKALENARVSVVCDILEEKAAAARNELEADGMVLNYQDLLTSSNVDAVIVATPCYLHAPMAIDAARAGKHVFTEKPMALSKADCGRMMAAADAAGVKLMVGQVLRYIGHFRKIREEVADGRIGKPRSIEIARVSPWKYTEGWRLKEAESGGMLFEVHVHELDYMACLLGEPESVYALSGHFTDPKIDFDDDLLAVIKFKEGGIASLHASFACAIGKYHGKIIGEKGSIVFGHAPGEVLVADFGKEPEPLDCSGIPDGVQTEIRGFIEAVINDTEVHVPGRDGCRAVAMAEAACKSAKSGQPVAV